MFKSLIIGLVAVMILSGVSYADSRDKKIVVEKVRATDGTTNMKVNGTSTIYTQSFSLQAVDALAPMYKATSDSDIKLYIDLEQSYRRPTTEGSLDVAYLVTDSIATAYITDAWRHATVDTLYPLPFGRFIIRGLSGNDASTTLEIILNKQ